MILGLVGWINLLERHNGLPLLLRRKVTMQH